MQPLSCVAGVNATQAVTPHLIPNPVVQVLMPRYKTLGLGIFDKKWRIQNEEIRPENFSDNVRYRRQARNLIDEWQYKIWVAAQHLGKF